MCITNLSSKTQNLMVNKKFISWKNLIDQKIVILSNKTIKLAPFQTVWLSN